MTTLTPHQLSITRLVAAGLSNKEIGAELHLSEGTVKNYLRVIFDCVGVDTRMRLTRWYWEKFGLEPQRDAVGGKVDAGLRDLPMQTPRAGEPS